MNKNVKLIFEDGNEMNVLYGTCVREVIKELDDPNLIALRINGSVVTADYEIVEDAYVNYINSNDRNGQKIYYKGLEYVYINAVKEILGDKVVINIKHSLDKGLYTQIVSNKKIDASVVTRIKKKMKEIIDKDMPFKTVSVSREDALEYSESLNEYEKVLNYTYMTNDSVTMYELNGEYNYFYYIMPPSTKILSRFDLTYIQPDGVLISYPIHNTIPKYNPTPKVLESFKEYEEKLMALGVKYAGDINKLIVDGKISDFIQMNEMIYNQNLEKIALKVLNDKKIRAIFISGPSSSGKTTTSKKLALYLKSFGLDSLVLSTDDYFVERVDSPKKPDGSYEFEIVDAIDVKLFSSHIKKLLAGEEVIVPTFNFITGEKEFKNKPTNLKKNQILIVEGLHAISEKINGAIDKKNKLRLYISPFMTLALDRHNHIKTTDLRLIRRMVRDYNHRGYSATATLTNWMGMRESEEKYVYPYQREADIVINTALAYEIGVLKTYAEPLLYSIHKDSEYYEEAIRILNFLKCFLSIPSEYVPDVSVLREFIGKSYFE